MSGLSWRWWPRNKKKSLDDAELSSKRFKVGIGVICSRPLPRSYNLLNRAAQATCRPPDASPLQQAAAQEISSHDDARVNAENFRTSRSGSFAMESSPLSRALDWPSSRHGQGANRPSDHEASPNTRHHRVGKERRQVFLDRVQDAVQAPACR